MRAYPDISLAGSNHLTVIAGKEYLLSGTSASASTLAGYFSNINAARFEIGKGSVGWINPTLYSKGSQFVNDITSGDNRCAADGTCCPHGFHATEGWDPTTGLGSVNFGKMQSVFLSLGTVSRMSSQNLSLRPTSKGTQDPAAILATPLRAAPKSTFFCLTYLHLIFYHFTLLHLVYSVHVFPVKIVICSPLNNHLQ